MIYMQGKHRYLRARMCMCVNKAKLIYLESTFDLHEVNPI